MLSHPRKLPGTIILPYLVLSVTTLLCGCRTGNFPQYPANYREYVYVANGGSDTVSVLDVVDVRPQVTLTVGAHPTALVASRERNEVYAAGGGSIGAGQLAFIDAEKNEVVAVVPLGRQPEALAIDPGGMRLYAANAGSNTVSVIDVAGRRKIGTVGAGEQPDALAVSPDGTTLVVANRQSASVSLMELQPGKLPRLRASFPGCPGAGSVVILHDSSKAFIACTVGHQVMVVSLRTPPQRRLRSTEMREGDHLLALLDVGQNPVHLALKPDGGEIFVANRDADTISEIETGTNEVGSSYLIGSNPAWAIASADNSLLWVANGGSDTIAVYSIDDGKLVNTVRVGNGPGPMAFSADGHLLLAADTRSGDVSVLRTFNRNLHREPVYGNLFTLLPAGDAPDAIVDKAFRLPR